MGETSTFGGSGDESDGLMIANAASGKGNGQYLIDVDLSEIVHAFPMAGTFSGIITLTLL